MTGSRLEALRARQGEVCLAREALKTELGALHDASDARFILLIGPGGIGKTTLARWFAQEVRARGGSVGWVSGEQIAPNPESFISGLRFDSDGGISDSSAIGRGSARDLLVIDSFEKLRALHPFILDDYLAICGANVTVLLASRERLPIRVRTERGLIEAFRVLEIEPLPDDASREILVRSKVPAELIEPSLRFARGFPLALKLIAEQRGIATSLPPQRPAPPELLDALVESFVGDAPSPLHRQALYAASIAPSLNESQLTAVLDRPPNAAAIYAWLASSSIVEQTALGISAHALVREVLFASVQRRDPEMLQRLQSRLVDSLVRRIRTSNITDGHECYLQALYARRNVASVARFFGSEGAERCELVPISPGNVAQVRSLILRFEGPDALTAFDYWWPRAAFSHTIMGIDGSVRAFELVLRLPLAPPPDDLADPLIAGAHRAWLATQPRPEEGDLYLFRWFIEAETYQGFTRDMSHLMAIGPLTTLPIADVGFIGCVTSPPEAWGALAPSFHMTWLPVEIQFADRCYGVFIASQKKIRAQFEHTPDPSLNAMRAVIYRNLELPLPALPIGLDETPPSFEREDIARALRMALPNLGQPHRYRDPAFRPLVAPGDYSDPAESIARLLRAGIETLLVTRGTARFGSILSATYLQPAAKQQAAATDLGLPYGTYRYQLRKAVSALEEEICHRLRPPSHETAR